MLACCQNYAVIVQAVRHTQCIRLELLSSVPHTVQPHCEVMKTVQRSLQLNELAKQKFGEFWKLCVTWKTIAFYAFEGFPKVRFHQESNVTLAMSLDNGNLYYDSWIFANESADSSIIAGWNSYTLEQHLQLVLLDRILGTKVVSEFPVD